MVSDGVHIHQLMRHTDFSRAHLCAHHDRHSPCNIRIKFASGLSSGDVSCESIIIGVTVYRMIE